MKEVFNRLAICAVVITFFKATVSNCFVIKSNLHPSPTSVQRSQSLLGGLHHSSKVGYLNNQYNGLRTAPTDGDGEKKSATVALSEFTPFSSDSSPTAILDYILYILTSDIGSIILGSIGLVIALYSRLSSIDYEASMIESSAAAAMGQQARADLLGVFASGAVLLNGVSKLDVTSVLAESVDLEGDTLSEPTYVKRNLTGMKKNDDFIWAMNAALDATPAKSAVILMNIDDRWVPTMLAGTVPGDRIMREESPSVIIGRDTPILDRFMRQEGSKESYLPTLQALPGKVEFTYLPSNCQEALALPLSMQGYKAALVLGSNAAKSFSPRDIAWCQILARKLDNLA